MARSIKSKFHETGLQSTSVTVPAVIHLKGGRPKVTITAQQVYDLAKIHCTADEISACLNCAASVIFDRFSEPLRRGHQDGQQSLKRKMHEKAFSGSGDTTMLIWLSKQRLGYKDRQPEEQTQINFNVFINEVPK
jgi:hypothetical protein